MFKTINRAIAKELETSKRLVIPEFGAFIRKDTGEVVFVEFLKKNDQVLESLMRKGLSISELEASVAIEEFVGNLKREVQQRGSYVIEGLGSMLRDREGIYELKYDPQIKAAAEMPRAEARAEIVIEPKEEAGQVLKQQVVEYEIEQRQVVVDVPPVAKPQTPPQSIPKKLVQKPVIVEPQKRNRADLVMIIAIVVALVAIATMIFGYTAGSDPLKKIRSTTPPQQQEQSAEVEGKSGAE